MSDADSSATSTASVGSAESAALRKLVFRLAAVSPGDTEEDMSLFEAVDRAVDRVERLEEETQDLRERAQNAERKADVAFRYANRLAGSDEKITKTKCAQNETRNELVRRAAIGASSKDRPMTAAESRDEAKGTYDDIPWQIIMNAWSNLIDEWGCFRKTTKRGDKALTVDVADIPEELVLVVEEDLDRDDLTQRLFGDSGGSR